ncbi:MAG: serine/threonine-protein kinase [Ignavibacteria bacterium]
MINGIISNYKILKQIGSGGMGMVYLAQHTTLERYAAVKVLNPEYSGNQFFKERFLNEATTLAKLNHPNIVSLYDFIEYEGRLLIIMEYVEGNTLDDFIKQNAYHDEKFVISVVSQILDGLSYAHRQNVVHRDIKPSNIIIGENDVSKILDFGIAKLTQSNAKLTKTGTRMGSVSYMSPEQILGKEADSRSDIYSLGVTLYEFLIGNNLYNDSLSEYEIQSKIINEQLDLSRREIPERLKQIINKATAKDPEERYSCCEEFKVDLKLAESLYPLRTDNSFKSSEPVRKTRLISDIQNVGSIDHRQKGSSQYLLMLFLIIAFIVFGMTIFYFKSDNESANLETEKIVSKTNPDTKIQNEKKAEDKIKDKNSSISDAEKEIIGKTVNNLLNSWQNMNVNGFFNNLTDDYHYESAEGVKRNYSERLNKAYEIFANNRFINISTTNMNIEVNGSYAEVSYRQKYSSTTVNESTTKKLFLRKENNQWKVYKELSGFN